jgi:hypothetical protein
MSKKYFFRVIAGTMSIYIAILFMVNIIIDPDMEYLIFKSRLNEKNFFHSAYSAVHLYEQLKTTKAVLVLGTSRIHQVNASNFDGKVVLNLHAIYGSPYAALDFFRNLDNHQWTNIEEIYFELSDITYNGNEKYTKVDYRSRFGTVLQTIKTTNFDKIVRAYWTIQKNLKKTPLYINTDGAFIVEQELPPFNSNTPGHVEPANKVQHRQLWKMESYVALQELDQLIKTRNIKAVFFTTPLRREYIECSNIIALQDARRLYVDILDGYYDLSYVEQLSNNPRNFSDSQHTSTLGKNYYLKLLKERDPQFYVTRSNLPSVNQKLKAIAENGCRF